MTRYPTDHAGLEIVPFDECLRLLGSVPVGRLAFFADGEMVILPVNHVIDGQDPVFRTARGSKLSTAEGQSLVCFEADHYDEHTRAGWSVVVTGRAEVAYEESEVQRLDRHGLHPWVTAVERPFWIRIRATSVSGRQTPGANRPPT
jgi:nitroimidazol reductase NimA-like FMN-containing flavoprotein (pyridoxamine 5'-phosphate oxidase superfamily)